MSTAEDGLQKTVGKINNDKDCCSGTTTTTDNDDDDELRVRGRLGKFTLGDSDMSAPSSHRYNNNNNNNNKTTYKAP